jgi:NAD-dependent dihydropyrimidine dehydrogenase PreA subunit
MRSVRDRPDEGNVGGTGAFVRSSKASMSVPSSSDCRAAAGEFVPIVDRAKCEGKAQCVEVCPFHVFEVRRIDDVDFARLGVLAKIKSIAHGRKTAYTPSASACQACGKCVAACPEKAIKLARASV